MDESPAKMLATGDDGKLRLAAPQLLPCDRGTRARAGEAHARKKLVARGFHLKDKPERPAVVVVDRPRPVDLRPVIVALVILLAVGAGLWRWRAVAMASKAKVVETPLEYHKRQFLAALRGSGSNAPPMQLRADKMRFHQKVLISQGFLAERKFEFTNGPASKVRVPVNSVEGVSTEYAMVEPRGNVLVVVAPREDMPAWESVMRLAGAK
jgi:hypothetical protein